MSGAEPIPEMRFDQTRLDPVNGQLLRSTIKISRETWDANPELARELIAEQHARNFRVYHQGQR